MHILESFSFTMSNANISKPATAGLSSAGKSVRGGALWFGAVSLFASYYFYYVKAYI